MDNTRREKISRARNSGYIKNTSKNYNHNHKREDKEENPYKKSIFTLQLIICVGLFTSVLLVRTIDTPFTNDIKEKLKDVLSENVAISKLYDKAVDKIESVKVKQPSTEEETTEKKLEPEKLVPTLE